MNNTFAASLKRFAYAVDYLDEESYLDTRDIILDYSRKVLEINFTRQLIQVDSDGEAALMPYGLSMEGKFISAKIRNEDGSAKTHAAYSFINACPLWIVSGDKRKPVLNQTSKFVDLWNDAKSLPLYRYPTGEKRDVDIKTSILIPLKQMGSPFGVLNFETTERLEITDIAKSELKMIGDAVSMLYISMINNRKNKARTGKAINELNNALLQPLPKLTKPSVFLASSMRAETDVLDIVRKVLKEKFIDRVNPVDWKDMDDPGNINSQLLDVLGKCRYGICYLSEPVPDEQNKKKKYRDNANVIFEAGMLHGRTEFGQKYPASWIPIREFNSEDTPFDLSTERRIDVERDARGKIKNIEKFETKLESRINKLLSG